MGGQRSPLGVAAIVIPALSVAITFFEIFVLQIFENCKIKLEQRVKLRSHTRLEDLFKVAILSIVLTLTTSMTGSYLFDQQGCVADYFEENSICKPCRDFLNPFCSKCSDRTFCNTCDAGFYPIDRNCLSCQQKDKLCLECDSLGACTKCSSGFFISNGVCASCETIFGCRAGGFCSSKEGCTECAIGFYLDDSMCKSCNAALSGCQQCSSSDVCTQCASNFLTINQGKCVCRAGASN